MLNLPALPASFSSLPPSSLLLSHSFLSSSYFLLPPPSSFPCYSCGGLGVFHVQLCSSNKTTMGEMLILCSYFFLFLFCSQPFLSLFYSSFLSSLLPRHTLSLHLSYILSSSFSLHHFFLLLSVSFFPSLSLSTSPSSFFLSLSTPQSRSVRSVLSFPIIAGGALLTPGKMFLAPGRGAGFFPRALGAREREEGDGSKNKEEGK